ncbi:hypothetical protein DFH08DRAFT_957491 [Mycena albidolilacea]|uniref:Uncharacterized protein n=1 Tax=Mycena albidolilacea TaxID=1033008 RepID=A0AAD7EV39_9AGAR|nr:hypothetical protein DFH08DRAFT_957491 [Mycena albidolilacea]
MYTPADAPRFFDRSTATRSQKVGLQFSVRPIYRYLKQLTLPGLDALRRQIPAAKCAHILRKQEIAAEERARVVLKKELQVLRVRIMPASKKTKFNCTSFTQEQLGSSRRMLPISRTTFVVASSEVEQAKVSNSTSPQQPSQATPPAPASSSSDWRIFRCRPSAPGQVDLQQFLNALFDGAAHSLNSQACSSAFVSSSSACSSPKTESAAQWKTELEECEERELAEAICMSLVESQPNDSTDKAVVPAFTGGGCCIVDGGGAGHRRGPRTTSGETYPTPTAQNSVLSKLSYSAQNQSVRFYSQALSRLFARLDVAGSFGDDGGLAPDIIEPVITETTALALSPAPSNIVTTSLSPPTRL